MTIFQKFLAFLLLMALGALGWFFIESLRAADSGITAAIIAVIGAVAGGLYTHTQTRKREIKARHFIEKKNAYMHFIDLVFKVMSAAKNKQAISMDELEKGMMAFKKELMVWGDQEVFKALEKYEQTSSSKPEPKIILLSVDQLLRAIRKDLGHDDSHLKSGDLVSMLIVADERVQLFAPNP